MRGNWRNDRQAAFMLLQKSCHDIDWIRYVMEQPCEQVSSFGNLRHFRRENQPAGAADNCLDCAVEASCPYSAKRIYLGDDHKATPGFLRVLTPEPDQTTLRAALRDGPTAAAFTAATITWSIIRWSTCSSPAAVPRRSP